MATTREYHDYVLERLGALGEAASRKMMGEYVVYYQGKVVGGLYDNRLLLKSTVAGGTLLPEAEYAIPYDGAKPMLCVDVEDQALLAKLLPAMYEELPEPKPKKKKT